jgi:hypothetical protein
LLIKRYKFTTVSTTMTKIIKDINTTFTFFIDTDFCSS